MIRKRLRKIIEQVIQKVLQKVFCILKKKKYFQLIF